MIKSYIAAQVVAITILCLATTMRGESQELKTVSNVELEKYLGQWYEIASYPSFFQKNCYGTTATYTLSGKGYVIVENRCNRKRFGGKESYIKGKAFVVEGSNNAKLKVQFFWPFRSKYWIIDLAPDYTWAVVSHPNKKSLWILSRSSTMDPEIYQRVLDGVKDKRFDLKKLKVTPQR